LLGKGFCVVGWAIAYLLMSLLPVYKRTAVSDRIESVIDTAAILLTTSSSIGSASIWS
jgi:hypothetical protein